jgi:hypothetical protein
MNHAAIFLIAATTVSEEGAGMMRRLVFLLIWCALHRAPSDFSGNP